MDGAVSCIPYAHPLVQSLIHAWKYLGVRAITQHLARFAAQSIHQASASGRTQTKSMLETGISQRSLKTFAAIPPLLRNEQVLMEPVPLHSKREKERGFNQSLLLAKALATGNPHWTLSQTIARTKKTAAQATLSGTDRHTNIAEAFTLADKGAARGRHIVLVDDVITTGSTVDAIARLLKQAGAESVWALTIAYGHPIH